MKRRRARKVGEDPNASEPTTEQEVGGGKKLTRRMRIWEKRMADLEARGTTPRDLYERDPFYVDAPPEVKKNVRFLWMSEIFAERRPICRGFQHDLYQPVTQEIMDEMGIKVDTRDRTPAGVPKVGFDAFLVWAPEEAAKQQDEIFLRGAKVRELMQERQDSIEEKFKGSHQGRIGSVEVPESFEELQEAETRQRNELGERYAESGQGD